MPPVHGMTNNMTIMGGHNIVAATAATTTALPTTPTTGSPTIPFTVLATRCAGVSGTGGVSSGGDTTGSGSASVAAIALRNCQFLLSTLGAARGYGNASLDAGRGASSLLGLVDNSDSSSGGGAWTNSGSSSSSSSGSSNSGGVGGSISNHVADAATRISSSYSNDDTDNTGYGLSSYVSEEDAFNYTDSKILSFYEQLLASPEIRMREYLVRYVYPIIIIFGNITNLIVLLVLRRKKLRATSVAFYLSANAIANLCVLDLMLGVTWVCIIFEKTYITQLADWTCRLWMFITNVMTYSGIWLVVAVNIDRLIFIKSPVKAQGYCTVFSAKTVVSFVIIGLVVVSIHAMWTYELQPQGCFVSFQQDLHTIIWPWWSATVYSYIPLMLLLILSLVQLITLFVRSVRNSMGGSAPVAFSNSSHHEFNGAGGGQDNFVASVLIISLSFFFLTVPITAINLVDIHLPSDWLEVDVIARIELAQNITEMLSSLNNSILGCILFVSSGDFRSELKALFTSPCCWCAFQSSSCCCCCNKRRTLLEMRNINSRSEDSSPHIQVDYELCNNNEENTVTNV